MRQKIFYNNEDYFPCEKCGMSHCVKTEYSVDKSRKYGIRFICRKCKHYYNKKYYKNNSEKCKASRKEYRRKNIEKCRLDNKVHRQNNPDIYRKSGRNYVRRKSKSTISFRISRNVSRAIIRCLKRNRLTKSGKSTFEILGYSLDDMLNHLQSQFKEGMTWGNHGRQGWHIDHRVPKSWFRYASVHDEEFKKCWPLSNLQPKWGSDNLKKKNHYAD